MAAKAGKSARFSFAELIGLAVTREVTARLGVGISDVGKGVDDLFHLLAQTPWNALDDMVVVLRSDAAAVLEVPALGKLNLNDPAVVVPCRPVLQRIRGTMLPGADLDPQRSLPFPPQALKA